ncbi:MAG: 2-oxoacid:acceptor oxidoreductase subunit alpha [Thermotogae bacterium]|nr:2-oxoacid:acceptor oxidoreductase subunit alpha [Thermotogota bacterium]
MNKNFKENISVVLSGEAGQGIQTIENLLTRILKDDGFNVFATKEYMSRIRGGSNSTEIRVGEYAVRSHSSNIDILIPLTKESVEHLKDTISSETIIIADMKNLKIDYSNAVDVPFFDIAKEIGNRIYSNIVAAGTILALFSTEKEIIYSRMKKIFAKKPELIDKNIEAVNRGYEIGEKIKNSGIIKIEIEKNSKIKDNILINGSEAVALGAMAGGCDSVFSYPMTPGTGVLLSLAQYSKSFGILVEQAEDEIAAINMAIGGWYAGARSMVTTSGGGFALMEEGVSLSGMIETPVVIHIAQRPGPATGLPTRTAQEDLNLALYSGHGEFPRAIYAPGNLEQALKLSRIAFETADEYQIPVFILTDQYFVDSYYNIEKTDLSEVRNENRITETREDYKRYILTENGISPRGIPGYGKGLVIVDSDEHDEYGHLTENLDIRIKMNDKRLSKLDLLRKNALEPEILGDDDYKNLIVCWGSNYETLKESLKNLKNTKTAMIHFPQLYPLNYDFKKYFEKAEKIISVENNATGQFSNLLKLELDAEIHERILKYDGTPFSAEELTERIKKAI